MCPDTPATCDSSSSVRSSSAASSPRPSHLQAAQRRAPCHARLHLLILQLLQVAHESLGGGGHVVGISATIHAELEDSTPGTPACLARTRWRKRGFSARLRSWADTALTTLLLPSTRSRLSAFSPSFFRRPLGTRFRARSTTSWSSELRFCASSAAGNRRLSRGAGSPVALPAHPTPGHPAPAPGRGGPTQGANAWGCWATQAKMLGTYGKELRCSGRQRWECAVHQVKPTCPPQGWLNLWVTPQGITAVLQGDPHPQ